MLLFVAEENHEAVNRYRIPTALEIESTARNTEIGTLTTSQLINNCIMIWDRYRNWDYSSKDPPADHATPLYPKKLAPISPTSGGRSVGIVRSRTKVTELLLLVIINALGS
jgi:hypothetical protein